MVSGGVEASDDGKAVTGQFDGLVAHQGTAAGEAARPFIPELPNPNRQLLGHSAVLKPDIEQRREPWTWTTTFANIERPWEEAGAAMLISVYVKVWID